jgi:hypothetical protein
MGCGHHAAVRFLGSKEDFHGVDALFKHLAELFHQIPFCATFGVSCAGHFRETAATDADSPDCFYPEPWGHLNVSVVSSEAHIQELLGLLKATIEKDPDASFKKIDHLFGPPKGSETEVWEIRIGDNSAFEQFGGKYFGGYLKKGRHEEVYEATKKRYAEIVSLWTTIEATVAHFCTTHGFTDLDIQKRVEEISDKWTAVKPKDQEPEKTIQSVTGGEGGRGTMVRG